MDFFEKMRRHLAAFEERQRRFRSIHSQHEERFMRNFRHQPKRKPPEAGLAVPVEPPRGPMPMEGGAEAPLNFED